MNRWRRVALAVAAAGLAIACAPSMARAAAVGPDVLDDLLPRLDPRYVLRVTLFGREVVTGHLARAQADTLWLTPLPERDGDPAAPVPLRAADIVLLEQRRSGIDHGAQAGGGFGAGLGALLGVATGLWLSDWTEGANDVVAVAMCTAVGAAAFAAGGAILGGGLGATGSVWYTLWPDDRVARGLREAKAQARADSLAAQTPRTPTRILVEAGWAATGGPYDMTGVALGAGLVGKPGPGFELGPVMRYHGLGGLADVRPTLSGGERTRLEPIVTLSLDGRLARAEPGWRPWVQGGLGLALASELYPAAHLGAGARLRDGRGRDWGLVIGRHFRLGHVPDAARGQWTASLVFAFTPGRGRPR
ncbi:hypothetical protein FJ250_03955 [bacterium]|nr:hypothetical protein [bacterium]